MMQSYSKPKSESILFSGGIESSVFALRERELAAFAVDRNSPMGIRLASLRGEFQRLLSGDCVRADVIERTLAPSSADSLEDAESDLATDPEAVEVVAGG